MESASSKNNIQSLLAALSNNFAKFFSVSPVYLDTISDKSTLWTSFLAYLPSMLAVKVFPVPGEREELHRVPGLSDLAIHQVVSGTSLFVSHDRIYDML